MRKKFVPGNLLHYKDSDCDFYFIVEKVGRRIIKINTLGKLHRVFTQCDVGSLIYTSAKLVPDERKAELL
jgi:hypothetical protein